LASAAICKNGGVTDLLSRANVIEKAELRQAHTQITKLHRKQIGSNHKISLARYRIAELAKVINDMETRHSRRHRTPSSNSRTAWNDHPVSSLNFSF
ncbi:hypothetical protein Tco_0430152, partial [Tanacetum coccineum]